MIRLEPIHDDTSSLGLHPAGPRPKAPPACMSALLVVTIGVSTQNDADPPALDEALQGGHG
eukprot:12640544-Alexandrium_andersonii.AAC.1